MDGAIEKAVEAASTAPSKNSKEAHWRRILAAAREAVDEFHKSLPPIVPPEHVTDLKGRGLFVEG